MTVKLGAAFKLSEIFNKIGNNRLVKYSSMVYNNWNYPFNHRSYRKIYNSNYLNVNNTYCREFLKTSKI